LLAVQVGDAIEHEAAALAREAGGVVEVENGFAAGAELYALVLAREEAAAPETREQALASSSGFYGWMLCGEALYRELARHGYALAEAADELRSQRRCFETFPHAITVQLHRALGLEPAVASRKRPERRALLERLGVYCRILSSIDWLDAALCALAAQLLQSGVECRVYGEAASGLLLVPIDPSVGPA
jgi:hypothetical protein